MVSKAKHPPALALANVIRALREGWVKSREPLAYKANRTAGSLTEIERGRSVPSWSMLRRANIERNLGDSSTDTSMIRALAVVVAPFELEPFHYFIVGHPRASTTTQPNNGCATGFIPLQQQPSAARRARGITPLDGFVEGDESAIPNPELARRRPSLKPAAGSPVERKGPVCSCA